MYAVSSLNLLRTLTSAVAGALNGFQIHAIARYLTLETSIERKTQVYISTFISTAISLKNSSMVMGASVFTVLFLLASNQSVNTFNKNADFPIDFIVPTVFGAVWAGAVTYISDWFWYS